jgi:hypothetical protein
MTGFQITCVNRDARGIIIRIGGEGWTLSFHEAIVKVVSQQLRLNILVDGKLVVVGIRGEGNDAYLVIEPEGFPLHNLTNLQSC